MNSLRIPIRLILNNSNIFTNYTAFRHFRRTLAPTLIELTKRKKLYASSKQSIIRSNFLEWDRNAELNAFNSRLFEDFKMELLEQAFTHKSYTEQQDAKRKELGIEDSKLNILDNQELVNEGKIILPKIIQIYLSNSFPFAPKECIMAYTNYLLDTDQLASVSSGIGTKDLILYKTHQVPNEILAEVFYALVAALKNSVNIRRACVFVRDILISILAEKDCTEIWYPKEPFKVLNDILAREHKQFAEPRLIAESGVNTLLAVYQVAIYSKKEFLGIGVGKTVEEAQNIASINALLRFFRLMDCNQPIRCNLKIWDNLDIPIPNLPLKEWRIINDTT